MKNTTRFEITIARETGFGKRHGEDVALIGGTFDNRRGRHKTRSIQLPYNKKGIKMAAEFLAMYPHGESAIQFYNVCKAFSKYVEQGNRYIDWQDLHYLSSWMMDGSFTINIFSYQQPALSDYLTRFTQANGEKRDFVDMYFDAFKYLNSFADFYEAWKNEWLPQIEAYQATEQKKQETKENLQQEALETFRDFLSKSHLFPKDNPAMGSISKTDIILLDLEMTVELHMNSIKRIELEDTKPKIKHIVVALPDDKEARINLDRVISCDERRRIAKQLLEDADIMEAQEKKET